MAVSCREEVIGKEINRLRDGVEVTTVWVSVDVLYFVGPDRRVVANGAVG